MAGWLKRSSVETIKIPKQELLNLLRAEYGEAIPKSGVSLILTNWDDDDVGIGENMLIIQWASEANVQPVIKVKETR